MQATHKTPASLTTWLRQRLAPNAPTALATVAALALAAWWLPDLFSWALWHAHWATDADTFAADPAGACWSVIQELHRYILWGRYPYAEQWRPMLATALLMALFVVSAQRRCWRPALVWAWLLGMTLNYGLLRGGLLGLPRVDTELWGGLPLTLLLSSVGLALACPLAVLLALGRRTPWPAVRALCTVYIEVVRGVPLVSVLFVASFLFPLFMPSGVNVDVLLRVLIALALFAAAYLAEVVRGGLQSLPAEQTQAAVALGMTHWQVQRHVVLPQALVSVLPGLVNHFIGLFKDTSLVTVVSLYELTGSLSLALNSDANWRPYKLEAYLFIAAIYFIFCHALSRYSARLEAQLRPPQ
jgi:general L-amino acid transport system permease protein